METLSCSWFWIRKSVFSYRVCISCETRIFPVESRCSSHRNPERKWVLRKCQSFGQNSSFVSKIVFLDYWLGCSWYNMIMKYIHQWSHCITHSISNVQALQVARVLLWDSSSCWCQCLCIIGGAHLMLSALLVDHSCQISILSGWYKQLCFKQEKLAE